jgi:hypothetical protein
MRYPVSAELGTISVSSARSPPTHWGAAANPPGCGEPVWSELDRHALRLFGPLRKPVREGRGLLRKQRRRADPPISGLAPSRSYVVAMAKRYSARPPRPRRASTHDLDRLVDPHGLIAQATARSGAPVPAPSSRPSRTRGVPRREAPAWPLDRAPRAPPLTARVATAASAAATATALPRLPKGKTMTFRAAVRAEVLRSGAPGVSKARRRRKDWNT